VPDAPPPASADTQSRTDATSTIGSPDPLVDVGLLADYAGFVMRSVRRHLLGALLTLVATMGVVVLVANQWPRTYQVEGRLLVRHSGLVSSLVNPDRARAREGEEPTAAAQEVVHSRENLLNIMKATNLMVEWERTRIPLLKFKDRFMTTLTGPRSEEQRIKSMVGLLEDRLQVHVGERGTVDFVGRWPDPQIGLQLVDKAMQNFLEYQKATEAAAIVDSIAILDKSASALESQVNVTLGQLPAPARVRRAAAPVRRVVPDGPPAEAMVRLARIRSALEERQQGVARLDAVRTQQLAEAQARLSSALALYTDGHPTVVALRQAAATLANESPELVAARRDVRALVADYDALSTNVGAATATAERERLMSMGETPAPALPFDLIRGSNDADPIGLRLKNQMSELATIHARASAARAELLSAEAGFKYQYSIVRPPQLPQGPIRPNAPAMLAAGAVASVLLALAFAVAADLLSGRILEAWQVERYVRAPVSLRIPSL